MFTLWIRESVRPPLSIVSAYAFAIAPLVAAALWGGLYVVSKWGFEAVPPVTLAFARVLLGASCLLAIVLVVYPRRSFSRTDLVGFGALGAVVALSIVTQFLGTHLTTASQGALVTVLTPIFTVMLGIAVLGEQLSGRLTIGLVLATVGTGLVLTGQYDVATLVDLTGAASIGIGMLLVASLTWAAYTVWGKPLIERYSALETAAYSCTAAVPLLALAVPLELLLTDASLGTLELTIPVALAVGYLGVFGTAIAWYCWYKGMEFVGASVLSVFFFAQPVVGGALGAVVLGESLGSAFLVGGGVMAVGVYLASTAGDV